MLTPLLFLLVLRLVGEVFTVSVDHFSISYVDQAYSVVNSYLTHFVQVETAVIVVGYIMVAHFLLSGLIYLFPVLRKVPVLGLLASLLSLANFIAIVTIYALLPKPNHSIAVAATILFALFAIYDAAFIVKRFIYGTLVFLKHKQLKAALYGAPVLTIDQAVYPVQHHPGCLAFRRETEDGLSTWWWSTYKLQQKPESVIFYSSSEKVKFIYSSTVGNGDCKFMLYIPAHNANQASV